MKEKRNLRNIYSGIKVKDNISFTIPKSNSFLDCIPLCLIALCGCLGIVNSFASMFEIDIAAAVLNFYTVLFFIFFSAIFINRKSITVPIITVILIYELLIFRKSEKFFRGLQLVCNQVYSVIKPYRGEYFRIDMTDIDPDSDIKFFIVLAIFLITAVICCVSIIKPDFLFGFVFTFLFLEIGLFNGKTPDIIPAFLLMVYWSALLAIDNSGYYRTGKRGNKTGFIRRGNTFTAKPDVKLYSAGQSGAVMLLMSAVIVTGIFAAVEIAGFSRPEKLDVMRSNVKTAVTEFSFDDIGGSLQRLSASFGLGKLKVYDHRLGNMNSISYNGGTDLKITANASSSPDENIYLKGYVGSVYDGKSWEELSDDVYKNNEELFSSLAENLLYPQDMLFENFGLQMYLVTDTDTFINDMKIESSLINDKYVYTPYNSESNAYKEDLKYVNDTVIDLPDKNEYSFRVSPYQDFSGLFHYEAYDGSDKYRDFVYENYLDVPNNADTQKLYDMFIDGKEHQYRYQKLKYIKKVLSDNAEYTLEPGRTPSGKDFASYFLTENHKGYCVHFATAGVILARMYGIPARYVEGYVVLKDDFNTDNIKDGNYNIEVKDNQAHAWAEIYIDGYGWAPYEFTPASAAALVHSDKEDKATDARVTVTRIRPDNVQTGSSMSMSAAGTSTMVKEQTTTVKKGGSVSSGGSGKNYFSHLSTEAKTAIGAAVLLLLAVLAVIITHIVTVKLREKSFNTGNGSKNAVNAYNYIIKLLEYCDIKNDNMQHLEFAEFAETHEMRIFKSGEFAAITDIVLEAVMSGRELSRTKAQRVTLFSYKTANTIFKKQKGFRKLYMKFIRNLC
ncbi:MAG: transglutaminase-like domain-containing protein [Clostridium sp.]|nr:transglutaminase-like domain-containing protein [Clostridium sp.]